MICARPGSRKWRASGVSAYGEIHQEKRAFMPEWGGALRRKQSGVPATLVGQSHERGLRHTRQALFLKESHRALFFVPAASHQRIASRHCRKYRQMLMQIPNWNGSWQKLESGARYTHTFAV